MGPQLEAAMNLLFPANGSRIGNLKFFRGVSREVTAEQLSEQYVSAENQIQSRTAVLVADVDGDLAD